MRTMISDGERIAILETRLAALEDEMSEALTLLRDMHTKMNVSKGAVLGATAVLGGVVGLVGFFFKNILDLVTGPPPH